MLSTPTTVLLLLSALLPGTLSLSVPHSPSGSRSGSSCTFTAQYDELDAPFGGLSDLKDEIPTPYHGLAYPGYHVAGLGTVSFQSPHSAPNTIFYNFFQQATVGQPNITTSYAGAPRALSFDAAAFYYSCIRPNPLPVYIPTNCTIQARGVTLDGGRHVSQDFRYVVAGDGLEDTPQALGTFGDDFRGLTNLQFVALPEIAGLAEVFPAFDDFTYTLHGSDAC